ncbi:type IVB secretion system protein IcmH/DotU [Legionella fairfieldensis]|uniref:type IVB secretion system protein IcmH/DotU n=1 Tax=Legionella fairfieldensis TaxID=45064 RepID=UPI00048FB441|nr:type IVB secretion system protein IcmH/DotU [Legionella fairfieldensis]
MTAEHLSASFVNQLSLLGAKKMPRGYYRSKLFIAPFTTNPLVAAAGPLLSLLERLYLTPSLPPVIIIRENIEHELRAFHSRLNGKAYTEELDAIAHYLLCATIDELLGKNYLRLYGKAAEFQAFTPSSYSDEGPERHFFDIVHYIKQQPNQYLDLLELAYYCLIAGFEGEQHGRADGRQALDNLIEELYQLIKQHRVNKSYRLFNEQKTDDSFPKNRKPVIAVSIVALSVWAAGYFTSHLLLEKQAQAVQFGHTVTARLDE